MIISHCTIIMKQGTLFVITERCDLARLLEGRGCAG